MKLKRSSGISYRPLMGFSPLIQLFSLFSIYDINSLPFPGSYIRKIDKMFSVFCQSKYSAHFFMKFT